MGLGGSVGEKRIGGGFGFFSVWNLGYRRGN